MFIAVVLFQMFIFSLSLYYLYNGLVRRISYLLTNTCNIYSTTMTMLKTIATTLITRSMPGKVLNVELSSRF